MLKLIRGSDRLSEDLDRVPFEARSEPPRRTNWTAMVVSMVAVVVVATGVWLCVWLCVWLVASAIE